MPHLTKEQLEQVKYVSIQDYCQRVDEIEDLEDKLAFSTRYILTYNQINNGEADPTIESLIKVAHMKIADKSADLKEFYQETSVNSGRAELMVDPTVTVYENDIGNQMFIADPVGYLKGQAKATQEEMKAKQWKSESDIQTMITTSSLLNDVFTDEFGTKIAKALKKPTVFDINARLENAFGGQAALKKAYEMGVDKDMIALAKLCSNNVFIPEGVGCCGFAGDRGFTFPELNRYGLRKLRPQIEANKIEVGYSNSRTCEIGLESNTGIPYMSIIYLVNICTTAKKP